MIGNSINFCIPSGMKDKQFVEYVTQGFSPEKSALKG